MRARSETGQAGVEWIALVLLLALLLSAMLAAGIQIPGGHLAESIAERILCAVGAGRCGETPELVAEYGPEIAEHLREWAPGLLFERGMESLPVDYRECRERSCADHATDGRIEAGADGRMPVAFTRVIDCREGQAAAQFAACEGGEGGSRDYTYLQYWFYYPDSSTFEGVPLLEEHGFHRHDWESFQVRIDGRGQVEARASSHHGHNHRGGTVNWASDAGLGSVNSVVERVGLRPKGGWGEPSGWLFVTAGSHAGSVKEGSPRIGSYIAPDDLRLIPIETVADDIDQPDFTPITPPWRKRLWQDPEAVGTS